MYRSGQRVVTQAIQKYLGSSYDVVKKVYDNLTPLLGLQNLADNADKVEDVADNLDDVTSVADNLTDVSAVADNIVAVTEVNDKVDDFNTKYLGSYASAPTVDGNGDPLVEGATYWDTTLNAMFVYTGSQWVKPTGTGIVDVDTFTGDGSTASFPLDVSPASKTNTSVFIDGVYQEKDTYSVSTNLITFNTAPNDEASIEVIVNEITNFITGTQTETHTLTSGQTVVNLTNSPAFASFHIQGEDVDSQRLDLGTDYTLDLLTNTITLTNSYPENTVLKMLYGYDDDISVELAPLNQAILDHVNTTENAHPASSIDWSEFNRTAEDVALNIGNSVITTDPSLPAYTGFRSDPEKWSGDNGTRLYLMPRGTVSSGLASGWKIFADPYHLDSTNYRDCGWYFSVNQAGDNGYHGNGVFYLNSKVNGNFTKNPDIAVTFQDGAKQAVKWTYVDGINPRGVSVYGKTNSTTSSAVNDVHIEIAGRIGFDNADSGLAWWGSSGGFGAKLILDVATNPGSDQFVFFGNSTEIMRASRSGLNQGLIVDTRVVGRQTSTTTTSLNAAGYNSLELNYSTAKTLTDLTDAKPGQEVSVIAINNNATIQNNSRIQLKTGSDVAMSTGQVVKLIYSGTLDKWLEI